MKWSWTYLLNKVKTYFSLNVVHLTGYVSASLKWLLHLGFTPRNRNLDYSDALRCIGFGLIKNKTWWLMEFADGLTEIPHYHFLDQWFYCKWWPFEEAGWSSKCIFLGGMFSSSFACIWYHETDITSSL